MKSILLALLLALLAAPTALAFDNPIPSPNQLVEQQLLPRFVSQLKLNSKTWHQGFQHNSVGTGEHAARIDNNQKQQVKQSQQVQVTEKVAPASQSKV